MSYSARAEGLVNSTHFGWIKGSVWNVVYSPKFNMKHLEKAEEHIDRNVVSITIKMRSIIRIFWVIKIIKLPLRNLDTYKPFLFREFYLANEDKVCLIIVRNIWFYHLRTSTLDVRWSLTKMSVWPQRRIWEFLSDQWIFWNESSHRALSTSYFNA